ncbi:hypothetical protein CIRMBP1231_02169 [Enterococcus cecorum]|uniref:hypothetical protein n=1 Tax=Bacillota TaxID=1239 RepID=UPI0022DA57F5|nr:hypothetical protein [Enterococcus cecorum]CAI3329622.1 hypothetical protein CIRMBP1246_01028 [Enterococcus cecorum]CAI3410092.1 hypothetical protein CIRMBP1314_01074 [Enterococcus cecorum]CAI3460658.1 hypothetical protein CIRMBP1231_02169 [Enterococcus cecorum]
MIKMKYQDIITIKRILGDMYLENGNIEEVVLLSQVLDRIIVSMQVNINNNIKEINIT